MHMVQPVAVGWAMVDSSVVAVIAVVAASLVAATSVAMRERGLVEAVVAAAVEVWEVGMVVMD